MASAEALTTDEAAAPVELRPRQSLLRRLRWPLMIGGPVLILAVVIYFLATAGRSLGRADWTAAAQAGLAHRLAHFHHQGQCHLWHHDLPVVPGDPGLFKGTAGFGYLLARMIAPELVPNVLLPTPRGT